MLHRTISPRVGTINTPRFILRESAAPSARLKRPDTIWRLHSVNVTSTQPDMQRCCNVMRSVKRCSGGWQSPLRALTALFALTPHTSHLTPDNGTVSRDRMGRV